MPARSKRRLKAEDLYDLQSLADVRLSPDGEHVVFSLQRVDRKTEKKYRNLWVVSTRRQDARQFTWGDQVDVFPRWSPDGETIAFLSNRGGEDRPAQIYLIPFRGGEARPLTDIQGEIGALSWSPDGRRLLCLVRKKDEETLAREKDPQKKALGVVARHYQRVFYKLDGYGYLPRERWHIWTVDARTGKARQLTDHPVWDERSPAWSPDGRWIAFISNRSDDPDMNPDADDIFIMPAEGGAARKLDTPFGSKTSLAFSPDGKVLAWFGREGEEWYRNLNLWVMPVDGSAAARNLTGRHDWHTAPDVINDIGSAEAMPPIWSPDGQWLYFQVAWHGSALLKRLRLSDGQTETVVGEGGVVGSFGLDRAHSRVAYFFGQMDDPGQVYVRDLKRGSTRHLTRINRGLLSRTDLGQMEEVWFKGAHGRDLQGWILKPPGFDPAKKYPSILEIHGGPLTQYGKFFMHEFYYLAAQGYVVYFSNPRGGRGYGEAHAGAIWEAWGTVDYDDLMTFTDYVEKQPYIDPARMGVTGGSYGGYMTLWIIGHTDRFRAAVAQRVVSNMISMWGSSDFNWVFEKPVGAGAPFLDDNLEKLWARSPLKYLGAAKTPTLIIHSEQDHRCPIEQGEQAFVALRRMGVESEFVRFPDSPHGLSRVGRTDRRIARLNHIVRWFDKYLK